MSYETPVIDSINFVFRDDFTRPCFITARKRSL